MDLGQTHQLDREGQLENRYRVIKSFDSCMASHAARSIRTAAVISGCVRALKGPNLRYPTVECASRAVAATPCVVYINVFDRRVFNSIRSILYCAAL